MINYYSVNTDGQYLLDEWHGSFDQWYWYFNEHSDLLHIRRSTYSGWADIMTSESIHGLNNIFLSMILDKDCF